MASRSKLSLNSRELVLILVFSLMVSAVVGSLAINFLDGRILDFNRSFYIEGRSKSPPYIAYEFKYPPIAGLTLYFTSLPNNFYVYRVLLFILVSFGFWLVLRHISNFKGTIGRWTTLWMLAPSFLIFSANSWDSLASIFTFLSILSAVYRILPLSGLLLGVASSTSIYSILLLPILYLSCRGKARRFIESFVATFVVINLPIAAINFDKWIKSYVGNLFNSIYDLSVWRFLGTSTTPVFFSICIFLIAYCLLIYRESRENTFYLVLKAILIFIFATLSLNPLASIWILPIAALTNINPIQFFAFDALNVLSVLNIHVGVISESIVLARQLALLSLILSISSVKETREFPGRERFLEEMEKIKGFFTYLKDLMRERIDLVAPFSLGLVSLLLLTYRLWEPNKIYFDEVYYVDAARNISVGLEDPNWIHPPLGKELISLSIRIFSDTPFAWRIMGVVLASTTIPATYFIALKLFGSRKTAFLSSVFLLLDPLYYAQTRIAMLDVYVYSFSVLAVLFYVYYSFSNDKRRLHLYLSGVFFGCAVASKLPGVLPYVLCSFSTLADALRERNVKETGHVLLGYFLIPVLIYLGTYIMLGYDLQKIYSTNYWMLTYSAYLPPKTPHPCRSQPWEWPVMTRPFLSLYDVSTEGGVTMVASISDFGDPITWFGGLIAFSTILVEVLFIQRGPSLTFVVTWFLITWLPYFPLGILLYYGAGREQFIFYFLQCLPPLLLMFARELKGFDDHIGLNFSVLVVAMVIAFFFICYPVISGLPVPKEYVEGMKILKI